jgi:fructose-1-phosphate kinase PfkB-like protein
MLFVAGLLEGFARQLVQNDLVRLGIAAASALVWGGYFYWPRRRGGA